MKLTTNPPHPSGQCKPGNCPLRVSSFCGSSKLESCDIRCCTPRPRPSTECRCSKPAHPPPNSNTADWLKNQPMAGQRLSRGPISCPHVRRPVCCCCQTRSGGSESRESLIMAASSVRWLKTLYVFLWVCPLCVPAFLNLEELNEMKYGIQILPDPVILGQVSERGDGLFNV